MNREKQCPTCKMVFPYEGLSRHLNGTYCWGDSVPILNEETKAIWQYWKAKKNRQTTRFRKGSGVEFLLTATEMVQLFTDAAITPNDIGRGSQQYALGRHNDTGNYEEGNCRFITARENKQEDNWDRATQKNVRVIVTPLGEFPSVRDAERLTGINRITLRDRLRHEGVQWSQWHYA